MRTASSQEEMAAMSQMTDAEVKQVTCPQCGGHGSDIYGHDQHLRPICLPCWMCNGSSEVAEVVRQIEETQE